MVGLEGKIISRSVLFPLSMFSSVILETCSRWHREGGIGERGVWFLARKEQIIDIQIGYQTREGV